MKTISVSMKTWLVVGKEESYILFERRVLYVVTCVKRLSTE